MLKIALIFLVVCCVAVILFLLRMSFKLLQQTNEQQKNEKDSDTKEKEYQLHPKLKNRSDEK